MISRRGQIQETAYYAEETACAETSKRTYSVSEMTSRSLKAMVRGRLVVKWLRVQVVEDAQCGPGMLLSGSSTCLECSVP